MICLTQLLYYEATNKILKCSECCFRDNCNDAAKEEEGRSGTDEQEQEEG